METERFRADVDLRLKQAQIDIEKAQNNARIAQSANGQAGSAHAQLAASALQALNVQASTSGASSDIRYL